MCCARGVTSAAAENFNALPENWATDHNLLAGLTVDAAVDAFTAGVAWVNHEEDVAGRLLPGMRADLAVLDQDLFVIPPRDIGDTSVVMTVAGGTVVHGDR